MPDTYPDIRTQPVQAINAILRNRGMRMTQSRGKIIEALARMERPASAEEIRVDCGLGASDLVTVYRNLDALAELGVLQTILLENGTRLFELTAPGEHHHHLICRQCHHTEKLDVCMEKELEGVARSRGFSKIAHVIEVHGVCGKCASIAEESK